MKKFISAIIFIIIIFSGCLVYRIPSMVRYASSITGDNLIVLYWSYNPESNIDFYKIYRSLTPSGNYQLIAQTPYNEFCDYSVMNGITYFYAVSAINIHGEESPLTDYLIYDTPRPEGYYAYITDIYYFPETAGWDFSMFRACDANSQSCDIYYEYYRGTGYIVCGDIYTDIQDMGYAYTFDDVTYAPEYGWSPTGDEIVRIGHIYVIWTRDDHYAKIYVRNYDEYELLFDWAYQLDLGNRELSLPGETIISLKNRD